jgi:hypothetical protein
LKSFVWWYRGGGAGAGAGAAGAASKFTPGAGAAEKWGGSATLICAHVEYL